MASVVELNIRPLVEGRNKPTFCEPSTHDELEHEVPALAAPLCLEGQIRGPIKSPLYRYGRKFITESRTQRPHGAHEFLRLNVAPEDFTAAAFRNVLECLQILVPALEFDHFLYILPVFSYAVVRLQPAPAKPLVYLIEMGNRLVEGVWLRHGTAATILASLTIPIND
jgi:hypothetical protein